MEKFNIILILSLMLLACQTEKEMDVTVYETSAIGSKLQQKTNFIANDSSSEIRIIPAEKYQTITGFGGSFTESSAHLLNGLSTEKKGTKLLKPTLAKAELSIPSHAHT